VAIFSSRQARITRTAISPRFAMRTFLNMVWWGEQKILIDLRHINLCAASQQAWIRRPLP